jgi:DNA ligase (NAD+)
VKELADLFDLTEEKLIGLPGFAEKNANRLVSGIQARKKPELARFLHALGIPEVGGTVSRDLAMHFRSLDRILEADQEALQSVPGIGPKMSEAIVEFLNEPHNRAAIEHIIQRGVKPVAPQAPTQTPLVGKKFVFTGGMERLTRAQGKKLVEDNGGKVVGSVSKETDFVVAGADPGSKYDKAVELGVVVLTEAQFVELMEASGIEVGE